MPYTIHYTIKPKCLSDLKITLQGKKEADKCVAQLKKMGFKVLNIGKN